MYLVTLLNIWLTLGFFPCDEFVFSPKTEHQLKTFTIPISSLINSLTSHHFLILKLEQQFSIFDKETEMNHSQIWKQLTSTMRHHLININTILNLDLKNNKTAPYSPGSTLVNSRHLLALFPFVGTFQSKLWGTATLQDLDDLVARIKVILQAKSTETAHLSHLLQVSNHRIDLLVKQVELASSGIQSIIKQFQDFKDGVIEQLAFHQSEITGLFELQVFNQIFTFFVTLHKLLLTPSGYLCGQDLIVLFSSLLPTHPGILSQDLVNTGELVMIHFDSNLIIIQVSYYTNTNPVEKFHVLTFDPISVGVKGKRLSLNYPLNNIVLNNYDVIGYLPLSCAKTDRPIWQMEQCPIFPFPDYIMPCLQEIITNETSTLCPLTLINAPELIQHTCTDEWILDSSQVRCDNTSLPTSSMVLLHRNTSTKCMVNSSKFILPASQVFNDVKVITPLVHLYHSVEFSKELAFYHPHGLTVKLNDLQKELLDQTSNWKHLENLTSHELSFYLNEFAKDQQNSAKVLSSILFKKYSSSLWSIIWEWLHVILLGYSCGMSTLLLLVVFCRKTHAVEVTLPHEINHEMAIIIADWLMIGLIAILILIKLYKFLRTKRYSFHLSQAILTADNIPVIPGQMMVFMVVGLVTSSGSPFYLRYLVGGTFHRNVTLPEEETFTRWRTVIIPPVWTRFQFNWKIKIEHNGTYFLDTHHISSHPPLYLTIPRNFNISSNTIVLVTDLFTSLELSDDV